MTEAQKILERIIQFLEGKSVLDLGCGGRPVVPWATGVDDASESKILTPGTRVGSIEPGSTFLGTLPKVDVVFSSHAIEHMDSPILRTLHHWLSSVKQGGRLILYLPDERRYVFSQQDRTKRNPGHHHYLTPETFRWYIDQLPVVVELFEEDPYIYDRSSFVVVARKK